MQCFFYNPVLFFSKGLLIGSNAIRYRSFVNILLYVQFHGHVGHDISFCLDVRQLFRFFSLLSFFDIYFYLRSFCSVPVLISVSLKISYDV